MAVQSTLAEGNTHRRVTPGAIRSNPSWSLKVLTRLSLLLALPQKRKLPEARLQLQWTLKASDRLCASRLLTADRRQKVILQVGALHSPCAVQLPAKQLSAMAPLTFR